MKLKSIKFNSLVLTFMPILNSQIHFRYSVRNVQLGVIQDDAADDDNHMMILLKECKKIKRKANLLHEQSQTASS